MVKSVSIWLTIKPPTMVARETLSYKIPFPMWRFLSQRCSCVILYHAVRDFGKFIVAYTISSSQSSILMKTKTNERTRR